MAASVGLKPFEAEAMAPADVWLMIEGWHEGQRAGWEQTRLVCFNVAKFGNSDPNKFPKKIEKYMPLPWDKETERRATNPKELMEQHYKMKQLQKEMSEKFKA